jgi:PncC family amidohydrolase
MRAMLEQVLPEPAGDGRSVLSCLYAGLPESGLDTAIRTEVLPVLAPQDRYLICAGQGFLKVRLVIQHPETAARVRRRLRSIFPDCCLSRTGLDPWPILVRLLARMRQSLAAAESCTGGAFGARLTAVPGASAVFRGAVVAYADAVKRDVLHVPGETLERHGAVSEETARAMAVGARRVLGSDLAVSLTGIAGPDGGTPAKPVGTVCIGLADGDASFSETRLFRGDREAVREQAAAAALRLILKHLSINHG